MATLRGARCIRSAVDKIASTIRLFLQKRSKTTTCGRSSPTRGWLASWCWLSWPRLKPQCRTVVSVFCLGQIGGDAWDRESNVCRSFVSQDAGLAHLGPRNRWAAWCLCGRLGGEEAVEKKLKTEICIDWTNFIVGKPGRVAQSVGHLTRKSGVLGSIPGLATYFRFSFRFFKKGSCQLLAKVCARSTG